MASAWGSSWGSAWGASWGSVSSAGIVGCFYQANFAQTNFIQPCSATATPTTGDPGGYRRRWRRLAPKFDTAAIAYTVKGWLARKDAAQEAARVAHAVAATPAPQARPEFEYKLDEALRGLREARLEHARRQEQVAELLRQAQEAAAQALQRDNDAAAFMLLLD